MSRRASMVVGLVLVLTGAAVALAVGLSGGGSPKRNMALIGPSMPRGFEVGRYTLDDADGRRIAVGRPGRVMVMTFLHSLCHSTCPVTAQTIRAALDDLSPASRRQIDTVAVTVAPHEDTRAHVRAFLREQRVGGFLHYAVGPVRTVRAMWKRYGIHPLVQGEDHSAFVFLIDRTGVIRVGYPAHQTVPEDLAHDLRVLVAEH